MIKSEEDIINQIVWKTREIEKDFDIRFGDSTHVSITRHLIERLYQRGANFKFLPHVLKYLHSDKWIHKENRILIVEIDNILYVAKC